MARRKMNPVHPGEVLQKEFLEPLGLSQNRLAIEIGVPARRINEIVLGRRRITADTALRLGANHPMGPLQLADFVGLDTCLAIMHVLYDGLADSKYRPCPLLVKYVEAGWVGRKSGRGFYDYSSDEPVPTR